MILRNRNVVDHSTIALRKRQPKGNRVGEEAIICFNINDMTTWYRACSILSSYRRF